MTKRALITGITGQDGSYLAELLLEKGYQVTGLIRRNSGNSLDRIASIGRHISFVEADMTDSLSLQQAVQRSLPEEVYNLAAMSHVGTSFSLPEYTMQVNAIGVLHLLEALCAYAPEARVYQASTSELFGKVQCAMQTEKTPFQPRSPYAIAKLAAFFQVALYRERGKLFACNGILFNHESPRRGKEFVTRKISLGVARIAKGSTEPLVLGNVYAKRDWGYAKEYVEGMWRMLQQDLPQDFILATGKMYSVKDFVSLAFASVDIPLVWEGEGVHERGRHAVSGHTLVRISPEYFRPAEVDTLCGDASLAKEKLGWQASCDFSSLVSLMVQSDYGAL